MGKAIYNGGTIAQLLSHRLRRFVKNFGQMATNASIDAAENTVLRCIRERLLEENNVATGKLYGSVDAEVSRTGAGFISTRVGYTNLPYGDEFSAGGVRDNVSLPYLTQWVRLKNNHPSKYTDAEWARYVKYLLETKGAEPYPHVEECWNANREAWVNQFRSNLNKGVKTELARGTII